MGLEPSEWEVLDAFEDPVYHLTLITLADGQQAWTYTCADSTSILDPDWSAGSFADHYLAGYVHRCTVWRQQYTLSTALQRRRTARRFCTTSPGATSTDDEQPQRAPLRPRRTVGPAPAPRDGSASRRRRRGRRRPGLTVAQRLAPPALAGGPSVQRAGPMAHRSRVVVASWYSSKRRAR